MKKMLFRKVRNIHLRLSSFSLARRLLLFLLLLGHLQVYAGTYYKEAKFTIKMKKVEVIEVLQHIQKQSEFDFIYSNDDLEKLKRVDLNVIDSDVTKVLDQCFEGSGMQYKIKDKTIVISPAKNKKESFKESTSEKQQKKRVITGSVVDETGLSLPGVSVVLKGTTTGVITSVNGEYSIEVKGGVGTLVYSFVGMKTQEVVLGSKNVVNVVLLGDTQGLDEVVIVGYGTQKKGSIIGSVDRIEPKALKQPTRTLSTSLAGRMAGVVAVQSSGEPGYDGAQFWIRGVNTFAGGSTPLILVDGVERGLDDIDPEEIADFSILKDATATAVYGVRGANGVVLISTKKGKIGKPSINLRMENGFTQPLELPDFVDGSSYMELQNEALRNSGKAPIFSRDQIDNTRNNTNPYYYPNVDWMDELIKPVSTNQRVNVNVSGGSEKVRYFVSGAFLNQNGMFKKFEENSYNNNINVKRYNFRSNLDMNVTKSTILSLKLSGILEDRNYPGAASSTIFSYILNTPPTYYPLHYPDRSKVPGYPYGMARNPYQLLAQSGYTSEYHSTLQSNMELKQDLDFITKGLRAKVMFAFDSYTEATVKREMKPRPYLIKPWGFDADGNPILVNEEGKYNYVDQEPSSSNYHNYLSRDVKDGQYTDRSVYMETSLMYNRNFGNHGIGGLLLFNQSDHLYPSTVGIYQSVPKRHQGLTGRATYSFGEKYFAEFNFGYNGSENFAQGKRYGFFPSYAIGWIPTKESFCEFMEPVVQYMKIKLSHGEVGNDRIGAIGKDSYQVKRFAYLTRVQSTSTNVGFGTNNGYGYGSGSGMDIIYYGNPDATWETATKTDLGLELEFLNNFSLQADIFYEKRTNIWTQLTKLPDFFGYGEFKPGGNVGEMENKGIDGYLEYKKQLNKDLSFNFKGTFSYAKNKVLANGEVTPKYEYQSQIGQPFGRKLGYVAEGYFVDQAEIDNSPDQSFLGNVKPGDLKYNDVNGDGKIDDFDRVFLGDPIIPEITYGLGAGIVYKNFDFAFLFQGATNVSFFAKPQVFPEVNRRNVWSIIEESRWTEDNQDLSADFPRLGVGSQTNNYVNSTHWLQDGSYLRLKQLEIGYSLPKSFMNRMKIKSARIYANGLNLFTISPFKWWDPESKSTDGMFYPPQKIMNIGLEVKF